MCNKCQESEKNVVIVVVAKQHNNDACLRLKSTTLTIRSPRMTAGANDTCTVKYIFNIILNLL